MLKLTKQQIAAVCKAMMQSFRNNVRKAQPQSYTSNVCKALLQSYRINGCRSTTAKLQNRFSQKHNRKATQATFAKHYCKASGTLTEISLLQLCFAKFLSFVYEFWLMCLVFSVVRSRKFQHRASRRYAPLLALCPKFS